MKVKIHPPYFKEALIECACGHRIKAGSTLPSIKVEICSHCHPLFTGKAKLIDKAGRIERFLTRAEKTKAKKGGQDGPRT